MINGIKERSALALACLATIITFGYAAVSLLYQMPTSKELWVKIIWVIIFSAADLTGVILEAALG
jgi:hypothetical protein